MDRKKISVAQHSLNVFSHSPSQGNTSCKSRVWLRVAIMMAGFAGTASAGTTWDGGGADTNINTAGNWDSDVLPTITGGTSTLTFGTGGSTATINTATSVLGIVFNRDANFAIANGAGSLTIGTGGINAASPTATSRTYTISESNLTLGGSQTWTVDNTNAATILEVSSVVAGAAANGLTKAGAGTLTMSGASTFSGTFTVNGGVAKAGVSINNIGAPTTGAFGTGTNAWSIGASGTVDLAGKDVAAGTFTGSGTITNTTGTSIFVAGTTSAANFVYDGLITETGGTINFQKYGSSIVELTSTANTFSGSLQHNNGTLILHSLADSGSGSNGTGMIIIGNSSSNPVLQYLGSGTTITRAIAINNSAGVSFTGASGGGATINSSGSGPLVLNGNIMGSNFSGTNTKTLTLGGTTGGSVGGVISNGTVGTNVVLVAKSGTSSWTLSGVNTYTSTTTISAGALIAGGNAPVSASGVFGNAASAITLGDAATTTNNSSPSLLVNGTFNIARPVTVANQATTGKYTIGGSNTTGTSQFTGNITLNQPVTLQAATGGSVSFNSGTWAANNNAITVGSTGNTGAVILASPVTSTGGITVNFGTLRLNSTFTGNATVAAGGTLSGTGAVTGTVNVPGKLAPGNSIGAIATGNLTLSGTSDFELGLTGSSHTSPGTSDRTNVTGNLTLGGTLSLVDNAGANGDGSFAPGSYKVFTYTGSLSGSFGTINNIGTTHAKVVNGGAGTGSGQGVFVDAYRLASASAHTPEPVALGNFHVGATASQVLTLQNTAANDGFSESLNAAIGSNTGDATSSGSFTGLAAGGTNNTSLSVGINTSTVGNKSGTATITLNSDGTGTSGYGTTALSSQTVNVSGTVYRLATASAHTPEPVNFGAVLVGTTLSQVLTVGNSAANDGFSEALNASFGSLTGGATAGGSFNLLAPGSTNSSSLSVGLSSATAGPKLGTARSYWTPMAPAPAAWASRRSPRKPSICRLRYLIRRRPVSPTRRSRPRWTSTSVRSGKRPVRTMPGSIFTTFCKLPATRPTWI